MSYSRLDGVGVQLCWPWWYFFHWKSRTIYLFFFVYPPSFFWLLDTPPQRNDTQILFFYGRFLSHVSDALVFRHVFIFLSHGREAQPVQPAAFFEVSQSHKKFQKDGRVFDNPAQHERSRVDLIPPSFGLLFLCAQFQTRNHFAWSPQDENNSKSSV